MSSDITSCESNDFALPAEPSFWVAEYQDAAADYGSPGRFQFLEGPFHSIAMASHALARWKGRFPAARVGRFTPE